MSNDEREYDAAAEEEISSLYRQLDREEPPAALDQAIRQAAREKSEGRPGLPFGRAALSAAASLMLLTVSVLMFSRVDEPLPMPAVADQPAPRSPAPPDQGQLEEIVVTGVAPGPLVQPDISEAPAVANTRQGLRRTAPLPTADRGTAETLQPFGAGNGDGQRSASLQELLRLVERAELTETSEQRLRTLEAWQDQIQSLLDSGRVSEAQTELERLRLRYPDADYEALLEFPAQPED